jgi:hypothetical protein
VPPEEAGWVRKYLELADHALNNHDLSNPAEHPRVTGEFTGEVTREVAREVTPSRTRRRA